MSGSDRTRLSYNSPIDFRISQTPPSSVPLELRSVFDELYAADQQFIRAFIDYCGIGPQVSAVWNTLAGSSRTLLSGNLQRLYVTAAENLDYGMTINLFNDTGVLKARKADASDDTRPCDGFWNTAGTILLGDVGEMALYSGVVTVIGVSPGERLWLDTIAGSYTNGPPAVSGNIIQYLGVGIEINKFAFHSHYWSVVP